MEPGSVMLAIVIPSWLLGDSDSCMIAKAVLQKHQHQSHLGALYLFGSLSSFTILLVHEPSTPT